MPLIRLHEVGQLVDHDHSRTLSRRVLGCQSQRGGPTIESGACSNELGGRQRGLCERHLETVERFSARAARRLEEEVAPSRALHELLHEPGLADAAPATDPDKPTLARSVHVGEILGQKAELRLSAYEVVH